MKIVPRRHFVSSRSGAVDLAAARNSRRTTRERIIALLEEAEDQADKPFDRYTDLSKLDRVDLSLDYVLKVSLYRRAVYGDRSPVKSAFYVEESDSAKVALTHAAVTAEAPLQVQVFLRKEAAAEWLDVTVDDLEVDR